ncbi:MAG: hypothetical protein K8R53_14900 [Bacteroidales bacterium]|nr:hypothetical protein [Bacteroidales bacterium]
MPTNLLKEYPQLLELGHLPELEKLNSIRRIFKRDIEVNPDLKFREKTIRPIKGEEPSMQLLFKHLTTHEIEDVNSDGSKYKKRVFEMDRSQRLHWIKYHIEKRKKDNVEIFSIEERVKRGTVIRTYIYDKEQKYVIVLEPQRSKQDYYLLSAYYLNKSYGEKKMKKKMKKKIKKKLEVLY